MYYSTKINKRECFKYKYMSYNESLDPNSNYPPMSQSEWDNAPWNQEENEEREVEVTISVTLSKTVKVYTKDYEDCCGDIYYSQEGLNNAVKEQIILPQEAYKYIKGNTTKGKQAIENLKDWDIDDIEIMEE